MVLWPQSSIYAAQIKIYNLLDDSKSYKIFYAMAYLINSVDEFYHFLRFHGVGRRFLFRQ